VTQSADDKALVTSCKKNVQKLMYNINTVTRYYDMKITVRMTQVMISA